MVKQILYYLDLIRLIDLKDVELKNIIDDLQKYARSNNAQLKISMLEITSVVFGELLVYCFLRQYDLEKKISKLEQIIESNLIAGK